MGAGTCGPGSFYIVEKVTFVGENDSTIILGGAVMANKEQGSIPSRSIHIKKGIPYYRIQTYDADGKRIDIYARSEEEVIEKYLRAKKEIDDARMRRFNPTVKEYSERWLEMQAAHIQPSTLKGYERAVRKYIIEPLGQMYMVDVTPDDIKLAMVEVSKKSSSTYGLVNMLFKSIFYSAEYSNLLQQNPATRISAKGGTPQKERDALTDEQVKKLLETIQDLPPYLFVMIGLYAGLRREEILGLKWDSVFLDCEVPYISVRRAWHGDHGRPDVTTQLKSPAARRDVPIPQCLTDCLKKEREHNQSEYVISNSEGGPLSYAQFSRMWNYIKVRTAGERTLYKYVNGQAIKKTIKTEVGQKCRNRDSIVYSLDFKVTPHQLRHTYITNLIYNGVDPKTVQHLAGHENSKVTMDIYAKTKYNNPNILSVVVNEALIVPASDTEERTQ